MQISGRGHQTVGERIADPQIKNRGPYRCVNSIFHD